LKVALTEKIPHSEKLLKAVPGSTFSRFFNSAQKAGDLSKETQMKAEKTNDIKNEFYSANKRY
jgi:hypothetical protein